MKYIYALKFGETPFYIGKTSNLLNRFKLHLFMALDGELTPLYRYMALNIKLGKMPSIVIIKKCPEPLATYKELELIEKYSKLYTLYNKTKAPKAAIKKVKFSDRQKKIASLEAMNHNKRILF